MAWLGGRAGSTGGQKSTEEKLTMNVMTRTTNRDREREREREMTKTNRDEQR